MVPTNQRQSWFRSQRLFMLLTITLLLLMATVFDATASAEDPEAVSSSSQSSLHSCHGRLAVVTGGTGQTGQLIVKQLLEDQQLCVRILTRNRSKAKGLFSNYLENVNTTTTTTTTTTNDSERPLLEFAVVSLGDDTTSIAAAFEPRETSDKAPVSHVVFVAGGDGADYDAVNNRGVTDCAKEAVRVGAKSMVVVSSAWVSKPYSIASLLFNSQFDNLPMAKHLQGEDALRRLAAESDMNYVILRPARLVPDQDYPQTGATGLWYTQGDALSFLGPGGNPGMSLSHLADAVVTAMSVSGKYTAELTSGTTPRNDVSIYATLFHDTQPTLSYEDVEHYHRQAVAQFRMVVLTIAIGSLVLLIVLGWKRGLMISLLAIGLALRAWNKLWIDVSVQSLAMEK